MRSVVVERIMEGFAGCDVQGVPPKPRDWVRKDLRPLAELCLASVAGL